ncbi:hypothetical protein LO762_07540 [Actinocorallia sp. API 0066]|uniref:hypothetical protein n=1 Tax=Actinocorallia sp. API 0066 TaxID=2896846 RepID=UPI001E3FD761|nr:hypothetical protein [Actinocorallia sp. API 0066]MCD0449042.1 hypothetical protein [Actinocorallia sp. API 0066]
MVDEFAEHPPRGEFARQMFGIFLDCRGETLTELVHACGSRYSKSAFSRAFRGRAKGLVSRQFFGAFAVACAFIGQRNGVIAPGAVARQQFIDELFALLDLAERRSEDLGLFVRRGYIRHRDTLRAAFEPVRPRPQDVWNLPTALGPDEQRLMLLTWPFAHVVIPRLHLKDSEATLHAALMLLALGYPDGRAWELLKLASIWAADTPDNLAARELDALLDASERVPVGPNQIRTRIHRYLALRAAQTRGDEAHMNGYIDAAQMFRDIALRLDGGERTPLSAPVQPQTPTT